MRLTQRAGIGADSTMEPTPALESAPYLEYVELIVSFPYFESNLPLLQSTHIKIHIQEQTVMSNNNIFIKSTMYFIVTLSHGVTIVYITP